ncbi:glycosyltransferase family 2 protein [Vibrio sp. M250220]|uniref:glycosyltransferase family 2 protein n=1 Tax=Vibrio sp. M250220 TaxID=3020894 RepID=UPI002F3E1E5E
MKVSLIITTYNWKEALGAVLESVKHQTQLPFEVIVADDGSRKDTKELLDSIKPLFPVPLFHSWQEDLGFRAAESRNKAIAKSQGDYVVIIDGDIYLPPTFIEEHCRYARVGQFIQGGRVQLDPACSSSLIDSGVVPTIWSKGLKNRKNIISNRLLANLFSRVWNSESSTRSCNMSFWRKDILKVNGFNNDFVGWGREDSELVHRLLNSGVSRLYLKFAGAGLHLYHKENARASLVENDQIYQTTIDSKLTRCEHGIDQFLEDGPC